MSRIGKQPIAVPAGVEVKIDGSTVSVKGAKGELSRTLPEMMIIKQEGDEIIVERPDDSREAKSLHGLTRTLVSNMVEGVSTGFKKKLELVGVGYRAALKGTDLEMQLGYSHPVLVRLPRASPSKFPARPKSSFPVPAKKQWARLRRTFASGASPSRTRARVFATRANVSVVSSAKLPSPINRDHRS